MLAEWRMLRSITFGTFYFFFVFCVILGVWVFFCVPETKGVRIEEMDKLFGGNQGEENMSRIADIRARLGMSSSGSNSEIDIQKKDGTEVDVKHLE
jgi:hypothetical protein